MSVNKNRVFTTDRYNQANYWFGTVISNTPPPGYEGRIKVRIRGYHTDDISELPELDLPWALMVSPTTEDGISGQGFNGKVQPGAQAFGIFLDDAMQIPLCLGTIPFVQLPNEFTRYDYDDDNLSEYAPNLEDQSDYDIASIDPNLTRPKGDNDPAFSASRIQKQDLAVKFFVDQGFTLKQAVGIVGNLDVESGMSTTIKSKFPGENSFGLAQWNSARKAGNRYGKLLSFASKRGLVWSDFYTQLQFVVFELNGTHKRAGKKLRKATSIARATIAIQDDYERPNKKYAHTRTRISTATRIYNRVKRGG